MAELEHSFSLDNIKSILKSMAEHFGPECEVVLHDFSQGYENSVVAIENGQVTGRKVGSSITTSGLETLSSESDQLGDGLYNYITTGPDGRIIRSSTALLPGRRGQDLRLLVHQSGHHPALPGGEGAPRPHPLWQ